MVLVNLAPVQQNVTVDLSSFGSGPFRIRDLWLHEVRCCF
jgi:hypothetical protein